MPGATTSQKADALRSKALDHPTVKRLTDQLDALEADPEPGLYVDTASAPGMVVNGELRVSVARVHSVDEDGESLVGQIQAVREVDHPLDTWSLTLYWHEAEHFCTEEIDDVQSWFVQVLDQHYRSCEVEPELDLAVEA